MSSARYTGHINTVSLPPDLISHLSVRSGALVRVLAGGYEEGNYSIDNFLPDDWDPQSRSLFWSLDQEERLEVCGFLTALLHEHVHQIDLLTTPFGANLHGKLAREYVSFQEHWRTLVEKGSAKLVAPLTDWLHEPAAGPDAASEIARSRPLGQLSVELRGTALFDDFLQGAEANRITTGWGSQTDSVRLAKNKMYPKITINKVWASVDPLRSGVRYTGPHEVLEGRALSLCTLYLWHITGRSGKSQELIRDYFGAFYANSPRYKVVLELLTGLDVDDFAQTDPTSFHNGLRDAVLATWYGLHSPMPSVPDDVLMSLPTRFIIAARALADSRGQQYTSGVEFLDLLDERMNHELAFVPAGQLFDKALKGISDAQRVARTCSRPEMRAWFVRLLDGLSEICAGRRAVGYNSLYGLPENGNVITGIGEVDGDEIARAMLPPSPKVLEWFQLRQLILFGRGQHAKKIAGLRNWFTEE